MLMSLAGCLGLHDYIPQGPAVSATERAAFDVITRSGAAYTGPPRVPHPLPPVQLFGVTYDLDLVIQGQDPRYDMHEIARILTPDGPMWVAKDADADRQQTLVADRDDLHAILPEVGVPRHRARLDLTQAPPDKRNRVDIQAAWASASGTQIEAHFRSAAPRGPQRKRNSSTMGHSSRSVAPVLDLSHQSLGRATLRYDGERVRLKRILGLVPVAVALRQTQAGLSQGSLSWAVVDGVVQSTWQPKDPRAIWPQTTRAWEERPGSDEVVLQQQDELRTIRYHFLKVAGALELSHATITQYAEPQPAAALRSLPAIPDLRRPFTGTVTGRLVLDVGGQPGHGVAQWRATSDDAGATLHIDPIAPTWLADRPMHTLASFSEQGATTAYRMGSAGGDTAP